MRAASVLAVLASAADITHAVSALRNPFVRAARPPPAPQDGENNLIRRGRPPSFHAPGTTLEPHYHSVPVGHDKFALYQDGFRIHGIFGSTIVVFLGEAVNGRVVAHLPHKHGPHFAKQLERARRMADHYGVKSSVHVWGPRDMDEDELEDLKKSYLRRNVRKYRYHEVSSTVCWSLIIPASSDEMKTADWSSTVSTPVANVAPGDARHVPFQTAVAAHGLAGESVLVFSGAGNGDLSGRVVARLTIDLDLQHKIEELQSVMLLAILYDCTKRVRIFSPRAEGSRHSLVYILQARLGQYESKIQVVPYQDKSDARYDFALPARSGTARITLARDRSPDAGAGPSACQPRYLAGPSIPLEPGHHHDDEGASTSQAPPHNADEGPSHSEPEPPLIMVKTGEVEVAKYTQAIVINHLINDVAIFFYSQDVSKPQSRVAAHIDFSAFRDLTIPQQVQRATEVAKRHHCTGMVDIRAPSHDVAVEVADWIKDSLPEPDTTYTESEYTFDDCPCTFRLPASSIELQKIPDQGD